MKNIGTLITSPIRPNDSLDPIATAFSSEIKGGHHAYATLSERDNIALERREWGMLVTVYNDGGNNGVYKLEYNYIDLDLSNNLNWVSFSGGSISANSWVNPVISIASSEPGSPNDGDRYLIGTTASGNWNTNENKIAQYVDAISDWSYTTPQDGYCVIVNNQSNSFYRYYGDYSSGVWQKQQFGGLSNKYLIENETVEIPYGYQYFVYGDLTIGSSVSLINYGSLITLNGNLDIQSNGTFSNFGVYYSPNIVSKYTGNFYINISGTSSFGTASISHYLGTEILSISTYDIINDDIRTPVQTDYKILSADHILLISTATISNGLVTIIG